MSMAAEVGRPTCGNPGQGLQRSAAAQERWTYPDNGRNCRVNEVVPGFEPQAAPPSEVRGAWQQEI